MKVCTKCGEDKPLSEYHKKKGGKFGLQPICKACRKAASQHDCVASGCDRLVKACTECGEAKPLSEYGKDKTGKDGHRNACKVCVIAKQAEYRERVAAERVEPSPTDTKTCNKCGEAKPLSEYHRKSASRDGRFPRCKVCILAQRAEYCAANPEKRAASDKSYYVANRGKILARDKAYYAEKYANDPEYRAQAAARNIRRKRMLDSAVQEPYLREDIFERDNWTCQLCQDPIDSELKWPDSDSASIDHIVPISHGGDDTPDNVQAAHFGCNVRKGNRVELEDQTMLTGIAG